MKSKQIALCGLLCALAVTMLLTADLLDAVRWMNLLLLLIANVTFLMMDRALERLAVLWHRNLRKRFFR